MIQVDWHHAGVFDNAAASARAVFLGASSAPDTYFDGIDNQVGAGDSLVAYNQYRTKVNNHYNNQPSQFIISDALVDYNLGTMTATVSFTVEVAPGETVATPSDLTLRSGAYEDDLEFCCEPQTGNNMWYHIGRALGTVVPLTISTAGQTQDYVGTFTIDPSWNTDNMEAFAFVQRTSNRKVEQSGMACKGYAVDVANLGGTVVSSAVPYDFDVEATYIGCLDDDVTVTLDKSGLPGDWDAEIVVGANTYPNTVTFPAMTANDMQAYSVRVIPGASAALAFVGVSTSPNSTLSEVVHEYGVFANTPAILYVNDDKGGASQGLYESAITNAGQFYYTVDVDTDGMPGAGLIAGFDAVIWNTGSPQSDTITLDQQAMLIGYLNGGGKLFVSSQGLMNQFGAAPDFIQNYLRVGSFLQDRQALHSVGVPGDPIGDGLDITLTNVPFPDFGDVITAGAGGVEWLTGHLGNVGMHYDNGTFQTVFLSAALELSSVADQEETVDRVLDWFFPAPATGVETTPAAAPLRLTLGRNAPNPFSSETAVTFATPQPSTVRLDVFDVTGRRVIRLVDGPLPAGSHTARWDGRDASGSRVASGVYLLRLSAGDEVRTKDMVLMR
ncbi:T9SS type A sorting domain-containing protein [bacterium]|nr:T9SS type A sorting domain-containing protein [bacterium]